jgi:hypothetical protein
MPVYVLFSHKIDIFSKGFLKSETDKKLILVYTGPNMSKLGFKYTMVKKKKKKEKKKKKPEESPNMLQLSYLKDKIKVELTKVGAQEIISQSVRSHWHSFLPTTKLLTPISLLNYEKGLSLKFHYLTSRKLTSRN